jgi:2-iminobutanoate/2-iminopropanoate deaminase
MTIRSVHSDAAPRAIGPYSQALVANGLVFVSGQIPLDPATGQVVSGDIADQTRRVLENLKAVLTAAGSSLDQTLKVTIYLVDLGHFMTVNRLYEDAFGAHKPARSTVQVAALPRGVQIEIDVVALA